MFDAGYGTKLSSSFCISFKFFASLALESQINLYKKPKKKPMRAKDFTPRAR